MWGSRRRQSRHWRRSLAKSSVLRASPRSGGSRTWSDEAAALAPADAPAAVELAFDRGGWIYVARDDGSGERPVTRGTGAAFSPDGSRMAFARFDRLYVARADGTGERLLSRAGRGYGVKWSPDGRRLAFTSHYRSGRFAVYIATADGSGVRPLLKPAHRNEESDSPAWSPDGKLIAFASTRAAPGNPEIFVVRPDGSGLRRLTHTRGDAHVLGDDGMPSWSPDGKSIVFTSNRSSSGAIWIMRRDGTNERKIYDRAGTDEFFPQYSPDGRRIAFGQLTRGTQEVWVVSSDGRNPRRIAVGGRPAWVPPVASPGTG
jgi:TolB protein